MTVPVETQTIALVYELPHSPEKVWRALTEPELVAAWLMRTDLQPRVGHRFTFKTEPMPWWDGIVDAEIVEMEPHKRLSYTWQAGPASQRLDTIVTWTLTPTASGTRLTLEHRGFVPAQKFAFDGAAQGWRRNIDERMRAVLAEKA
jgi:uncharacterized protein YndB with AHSA1/START domain